MAKIVWDRVGERFYETGVDHGVLYLQGDDGDYLPGVAWNGLTAINESPSGAEATALYADNIKYLNLMSAEEFGATIEAYTYPDEFEECDGSLELVPGVIVGQQVRRRFGMAYRTLVGNDVNSRLGYKIHIIYGATAAPSGRNYATVNDNPEAINFSWEINTTTVEVGEGFNAAATLVIDSTKVSPEALKALEDILYGTESDEPRLPTPAEIAELVGNPVEEPEDSGEEESEEPGPAA